MSDIFKKKKSDDKPSDSWLMTYADLMSLLMCFFVLLLSFSEMDLQKYKQISGSMKDAFGVQREIKTMDMPKGTSIIAQNFSPGRPSPSVLKVMKQESIDETKQTLNFTDALTENEEGKDVDDGEVGDRSNRPPNMTDTGTKESIDSFDGGNLMENVEADTTRDYISNIIRQAAMEPQAKAEIEKLLEALKEAKSKIDIEKLLAALKLAQTRADAEKLLLALKKEIEKGMVEVESEGTKILIRIREKGSFPSGSATFRDDFLPVLAKLRDTLATVPGKVLIAGHTDNVPINTSRFRSNWELSSSRAVSVVHELLREENLEANRFLVEGHGDAHPIAPNDSQENRALNRRVELTIVQGDNDDETGTQEFEDLVNNALSKSLEITEQPGPEEKEEHEQTAMLDQQAVPEVSIEYINDEAIIKTETNNQTEELPAEESKPETVNQEEIKADLNNIEERIRRFTEKMEQHRK